MSGPTYTLNLKKRITYAEFKALPEGLQNIIDKYRVGTCRAYGCERRRLPEQERLFLQARFSTYEGRPRKIP
jgi:hypothetical protein